MTDNNETVANLASLLPSYETQGDLTSLMDTIVRIAELIDRLGDGPAAALHMPRLLIDAAAHPLADNRAESMKHLVAQRHVAGSDIDPTSPLAIPAHHRAYAAVRLLAGGMLTTGEYIVILETIARLCRQPEHSPASTLHAVHAGAPRKLAAVMQFVSQDAHAPLLPLARYRPQAEADALLPRNFAAMRGALAFDFLDCELMVALLNPYDSGLREEVAQTANRRCLFYTVSPADYDSTLSMLGNGAAHA